MMASSARPHVHTLRVFYEDTDAGGVVYYANYLKFAERARTELLRAMGISQRALAESDGTRFAVRRVNAEFLSPARLDDEIEVRTAVADLRGASVTMDQSVHRAGRLLATLSVQIACVGPNGRPRRLPDRLATGIADLAGLPTD